MSADAHLPTPTTGTGADLGLAPEPPLTGNLGEDAAALAEYAAAADRSLAALPPRPEREAPQQAVAERVLAAARRLRAIFLDRHVEAVYGRLTGDRTHHVRLPDLLRAAGEQWPGLVPTEAQLDAERKHIQAHKEGREIDQGLFLRAVLRDPASGAHLTDAMRTPSRRALALLADFTATGRAELESVLVERRGPAAHLTVHNEHCLNAEDDTLIADMETAVDLALLDDRVRVGVLRGGVMTHPKYAGRRVFSAGINLRHLHEGRISFAGFLMQRELGYISKIQRGLHRPDHAGAGTHHPGGAVAGKPWVAAVDAFAIGGGMQLLLVFDRVIAERDAFFALPAAQEGIVPGAGNLRLSRCAGARQARRVILWGDRITAGDPGAAAVCDQVVAPEEMDTAIEEAVSALDNPAVVANRAMLTLAEEPPELFRTYMAEFAYVQAIRLYSRDVIGKVDRAWSRAGGRP
ncbi:(3,5-dihydroxyphenyl)acetyl-CoA 1,2-dioxygenase DpgC [Streptomyces sp. YGL11-2]|uniref:(3,5-dihydroxyphenyl)acetyl-CoA 1,2-dioxygenase DpgC n=1 Tax=Streptomyces sp. YGL11-2 TaxID=3414028 RepID=UPI003CF45C00